MMDSRTIASVIPAEREARVPESIIRSVQVIDTGGMDSGSALARVPE